MPQQNVPVQWQIAADENMRHVVRVGTAIATPELAHSVHIDVRGLESAREYFYQFKATSTAPSVALRRHPPAKIALIS
jgi:alkaline phosphatase D